MKEIQEKKFQIFKKERQQEDDVPANLCWWHRSGHHEFLLWNSGSVWVSVDCILSFELKLALNILLGSWSINPGVVLFFLSVLCWAQLCSLDIICFGSRSWGSSSKDCVVLPASCPTHKGLHVSTLQKSTMLHPYVYIQWRISMLLGSFQMGMIWFCSESQYILPKVCSHCK